MENQNKTADLAQSLRNEISKSFKGSDSTIDFSILGLLASLHVLIEDVPGVGKTTLAKALSQAAGLSFSRIQFTPDMLPGDVLGMNVWVPSKNEFVYKEGPIHSECILADELNRTSPRTQSAFLEAMQEGQVSVDGVTRNLPDPFFMIATQNPLSFTGTFQLPEAELDRFGLSFSIGYPAEDVEISILEKKSDVKITAIADADTIRKVRKIVNETKVSPAVQRYIIEIIRGTRDNPLIQFGASPRAAVFLQQAAKGKASMEGRDFVMPEDVGAVCSVVLPHRIILSPAARLENTDTRDAVSEVLSKIQIPAGV
ncbi:MAG: MoxR family ATPase [Treponema sp.]|nr:MoxR family ATPase [Treponema sp.]